MRLGEALINTFSSSNYVTAVQTSQCTSCLSLKKASNMSWKVSDVTFSAARTVSWSQTKHIRSHKTSRERSSERIFTREFVMNCVDHLVNWRYGVVAFRMKSSPYSRSNVTKPTRQIAEPVYDIASMSAAGCGLLFYSEGAHCLARQLSFVRLKETQHGADKSAPRRKLLNWLSTNGTVQLTCSQQCQKRWLRAWGWGTPWGNPQKSIKLHHNPFFSILLR